MKNTIIIGLLLITTSAFAQDAELNLDTKIKHRAAVNRIVEKIVAEAKLNPIRFEDSQYPKYNQLSMYFDKGLTIVDKTKFNQMSKNELLIWQLRNVSEKLEETRSNRNLTISYEIKKRIKILFEASEQNQFNSIAEEFRTLAESNANEYPEAKDYLKWLEYGIHKIATDETQSARIKNILSTSWPKDRESQERRVLEEVMIASANNDSILATERVGKILQLKIKIKETRLDSNGQ